VVEGTLPVSEIVFSSHDLSCEVSVVECVDWLWSTWPDSMLS
jgi:hypothetical protein